MEKVYGLTLDFQYLCKSGQVLGETIFEDSVIPVYERRTGEGYKLIHVNAGTVLIDAGLACKYDDGQLRFTCAHELAHWVIDKK